MQITISDNPNGKSPIKSKLADMCINSQSSGGASELSSHRSVFLWQLEQLCAGFPHGQQRFGGRLRRSDSEARSGPGEGSYCLCCAGLPEDLGRDRVVLLLTGDPTEQLQLRDDVARHIIAVR